MTKKDLRQHIRGLLSALAPQKLHEQSVKACSLLIETREYKRSEIILVFLSLPNEIDTTPLVLDAWRNRKRVLAPKVNWDQRRMLPIEIRSLSDDLDESRYGLREPANGNPFPITDIDMVIVPGLGFDLQGHRIGRGRGFYDHFLAHEDWHGIACGLALEQQVIDEVPIAEHDIPIDMLVTDAEIRRFSHKSPVKS
ncbi:MAG: 5-formyltetrahydrofolate cyclo-ligase [Planctomycetota bacterium]|nr:MAG: 5-formyltetrahydrofolate cyclo-ligase [Planctomycetota bacterium]